MGYEVLPELTPFNRAWFTGGALAVQYCPECQVLQHPPEEMCHRCGRFDLTTKNLTPTGTVYSHTVVHYAASPNLADKVPYTLVLVALDDAPEIRVLGDLLGDDPRAVRIGLPVVAEWSQHQVGNDVVRLAHWRPA
jgi:uncharacterized OB-fold protein